MSAISFAKAAFGREKPHSSITTLVDILTSSDYEAEAYDGIPELANSINLQGSGPTEASRALRKKLKHGGSHQQYRSLVILKALVENCGHKFQTTFADGQLTDALRNIGNDPSTDPRVKRKLLSVLASWHTQFKTDPSMTLVAGLFQQCRLAEQVDTRVLEDAGLVPADISKKKLEAKKAKREKEMAKKEAARKKKEKEISLNRRPFNFEKERPQVLHSIASASQASSNLVNAIVLVNQKNDNVQSNERVQECLHVAKQVRKAIVRYIQLVEDEDLIGTLIETNDRIVSALGMYDKAASPAEEDNEAEAEAAHGKLESEVAKLQERQRAAVKRARGDEAERSGNVHPDLQDLSFGPLGNEKMNLPPPLRPSAPGRGSPDADPDPWQQRGSLSDFSDYESSDEETHKAAGGSSAKAGRSYLAHSDDDEFPEREKGYGSDGGKLVDVDDDPFADPFA